MTSNFNCGFTENLIDISILQIFLVPKIQQQKGKIANQQEVMKFFMPPLLAELAMDAEVIFRSNSSDDFQFYFASH